MKRPLVVGSVAFDLIFGVRGKIQDEILVERNGRLGRQNLMFTARRKESFFGGTGANIAYGLGLLGARPLLVSLAGKDFRGEFESHLKKSGVDIRVSVNEAGWTATFYGMSDELGQQIGVYQPNAYEGIDALRLSDALTERELAEVGVAIFSAGTGKSIYRQMKELRETRGKEAAVIFDPGQVISVFYDKKLLERTLRLADIFIGNETEIRQLQKILGYDIAALLRKGVRAVIETRGESGSILYQSSPPAAPTHTRNRKYVLGARKIHIPAAKARKTAEATGAGDAYRAGMIAKLLEEKSLKEACEFGAAVAARSVAFRGAQTYII